MGSTAARRRAALTRRPIDPSAFLREVADKDAGGTVLFVGTVRRRGEMGRVDTLEYQSYREMAETRMKEIETDVKKKWPITKIRMLHREGKLRVGEVSVVVAVSSAHRAEAFEACRYAIDRIKRSLPLWKRELERGRGKWVAGSPIARR
ncbi:MAG: molybdenum cofactor biosynthesis protein MoaE [Nitrososphaerota archaeon]|nr:molybdenum cofactor biosynthesis protein MoaE [Nitrososphaerota archaeon]